MLYQGTLEGSGRWTLDTCKPGSVPSSGQGIIVRMKKSMSLGLQIAQSRPNLYTLGPKVGIIYIHGVPVFVYIYMYITVDQARIVKGPEA